MQLYTTVKHAWCCLLVKLVSLQCCHHECVCVCSNEWWHGSSVSQRGGSACWGEVAAALYRRRVVLVQGRSATAWRIQVQHWRQHAHRPAHWYELHVLVLGQCHQLQWQHQQPTRSTHCYWQEARTCSSVVRRRMMPQSFSHSILAAESFAIAESNRIWPSYCLLQLEDYYALCMCRMWKWCRNYEPKENSQQNLASVIDLNSPT